MFFKNSKMTTMCIHINYWKFCVSNEIIEWKNIRVPRIFDIQLLRVYLSIHDSLYNIGILYSIYNGITKYTVRLGIKWFYHNFFSFIEYYKRKIFIYFIH